MIESKKLESRNRSKGALIFAFNNESIDYINLARINALLIKKHYNLPTTLVTDTEVDSTDFDKIIIVENTEINKRTFRWTDGTETVNWRNFGRYDAYSLSPYDRTILLDADYIVNSPALLPIINSDADLCAFRSVFDITGHNIFKADETINFNSLDMYWATVIIFNKTEANKCIFRFMKTVKENWEYFRNLYNFDRITYRNDYSFTIAVNTLNGFTNKFEEIPWRLPTLGTEQEIYRITDNKEILYSFIGTRGQSVIEEIGLCKGDLHIMNKKSADPAILEKLL